MGYFSLIRPRDDAPAKQASDWADELANKLKTAGHTLASDVDNLTPADRTNIENAISGTGTVIFYFGHGDEDKWRKVAQSLLDTTNIQKSRGKCVISIACKTGRNLGPDSIIAGAEAWLGFNIAVGVISPYKGFDPIGEALVDALAEFGSNCSVQDVRDEVVSNLDKVAKDHDNGGSYANHHNAVLVYFTAVAMRDNVVALGNNGYKPL